MVIPEEREQNQKNVENIDDREAEIEVNWGDMMLGKKIDVGPDHEIIKIGEGPDQLTRIELKEGLHPEEGVYEDLGLRIKLGKEAR